MKRLIRWMLGGSILVVAGFSVVPGCSSGGGGEKDIGIPLTGEPCDAPDGDEKATAAQCGSVTSVCLTDSSFTELTEGEMAEIPGGFCTKLACDRTNTAVNAKDENCGEGSFCFNLQQYTGMPLGVCGLVCETDADCRDEYLCVDGSSEDPDTGEVIFTPLPFRTCLPPELLCLLDIPNEQCPDARPPIDGGAGDGGGGAGDAATDA